MWPRQLFYDKRVPWLLTMHVLAKPSMGLLDRQGTTTNKS
jgi:hypothetical protein